MMDSQENFYYCLFFKVVTSFSYEKETGKLMDNFGEMTLPGVNRDQILAKLKDLTSASGTPLESA